MPPPHRRPVWCRYKCGVCEDVDLCDRCMRALVAARVRISQEAGPLREPPAHSQRPKRWVSKLRSEDGAVKWGALQAAVPCLHPTHHFSRVESGPERAVVLQAGAGPDALAAFLETFPPSRSSCSDVAWLVINLPGSEEPQQPASKGIEAS